MYKNQVGRALMRFQREIPVAWLEQKPEEHELEK